MKTMAKKLLAGLLTCMIILAGLPAAGIGPVLNAASKELHIGQNVISFPDGAASVECSLKFDSDPVPRLRYEITASDPNIDVSYTTTGGGGSRRGSFRINDAPGSSHAITVSRLNESQKSVTLTVKKMPRITSIVPLGVPDLVPGGWEFATNIRENLKLEISYEGGSKEEILMNDFEQSSGGSYYEDKDLHNLIGEIDDLKTYGGSYVYQKWKFDPCTDQAWNTILKIHLLPFNESDYSWIKPDNTRYKITGPGITMFRIKLDHAGFYAFSGYHAEGGALGAVNGEGWGGYGAPSSVQHGYFNAGEYWYSAKMREDENGRIPSEGYIWCFPQAEILSLGLEVNNKDKITWGNWQNNIKRVIKYKDPKTGAVKTCKAG